MVFLLTWFYTRITFLCWWLTGSLCTLDFFNRHHFLFSHKFCTTEFWAGFWWHWFCGIYGSSSLSQPPSLPCLSFSQSTVWYRRSSFSGRNIWSIASSWLQSSSFQQQSSFRFGSRSIYYSRQVFLKGFFLQLYEGFRFEVTPLVFAIIFAIICSSPLCFQQRLSCIDYLFSITNRLSLVSIKAHNYPDIRVFCSRGEIVLQGFLFCEAFLIIFLLINIIETSFWSWQLKSVAFDAILMQLGTLLILFLLLWCFDVCGKTRYRVSITDL